MKRRRLFEVLAWIEIPSVMYGGYSLLRLLEGKPWLTDFRRTWFRAGHAHAGVLLLMSLLYHQSLDRTSLSDGAKTALSTAVAAGTLAQSGGFFLHLAVGEEGKASPGTAVTAAGAFTLVASCLTLAGALTRKPSPRNAR